MRKILFGLATFALAVTCQAGEPIVTTALAISTLHTNADEAMTLYWQGETNSITIPNGQAARVSMLKPRPVNGSETSQAVWMEKGGLVWGVAVGEVVQGPARFVVATATTPAFGNQPPGAMLTLERWRVPKALPVNGVVR